MNRRAKAYGCRLLPLLFVAVMLSACVNTLELAVPRGGKRAGVTHEGAVANAREYFLSHFGNSTRSEEQQPTPEAPYVVGNLVPDWESGVTVANEEKSYTDFAMQKDYRYLLLLGEDDTEQAQAMELYSRFVSVVDINKGVTSQYVATYIPHEEYLAAYGSVACDGYGIDCSENYEFSGVVLYTLPSGHHVAAYRYEGGKVVQGSFLYNMEQTEEENIADFMAVVEGLRIGVGGAQEGTRSDAIYGGTIEEIVFVYNTAFPIIIIDNTYSNPWDDDNQMIEPFDHFHIVLGGGGGGTTTTEENKLDSKKFADKILKNSLSPADSAQLHSMLTEILADCMGQTLLQKIYDNEVQINITFDYNSDNSQYQFNRDIHSSTVVMCNDHSEGLVHELFHFVQHYTLGYDAYQSAYVNFEVEAHIASLMYMSHTTNSNAYSRYDAYRSTTWGGFQEDCAMYLNADGSIPQSELWKELFETAFDDAAWYYKRTHQNRNYDTNRDSENNISNLSNIFKNCD